MSELYPSPSPSHVPVPLTFTSSIISCDVITKPKASPAATAVATPAVHNNNDDGDFLYSDKIENASNI